MQRYFHLTLLFLAIYVITTGGLFSSNSYLTLTWAEEQINSEDEGKEQDDAHAHAAKNAVTLTDKAKANIGLKTVEADLRAIEKVVQVTGNIIAHPGKQAIVTPRIGGIVKRIHFNLGDSVKEGDVLLELESVDLQLAEIDLIEAVQQQKSLNTKLTKQKSAFAEQIRLELQTRQIDYLESFTEMQEQKTAYLKHKALATAKTISALEQMRVDLVKADVERKLLTNTLERVETLTEKRISAQKEFIAKKAEYTKATNAFTGVKRQFQILGISEQTLEKILSDDGTTPILVLLNIDSKNGDKSQTADNVGALKYVTLIEEASGLVDAETAYKSAVIKVEANKRRALATGLTETHLETIAKTDVIVPFKDLSADKLIENYAPFMTSSEALEALLQTEEAQRNAAIVLAKVEQKLKVFGRTTDEINKIIETGKSHSRLHVTAPTAGQIIKQDVTLGATVEKSSSLYAVLNTDVVWVEGEAYEDMLALLQDKWKIGSEVRIRVPAYPGTVFTGKISQISAVVNPEKRTVHFWTAVDNSTRQLKPGMFAEQTLVIEKLDDVLSVPLNAVLEDGATKFVFVETDNTYLKHEVAVGAKDDRYVEIKDGLLAGERVVVQGAHQLKRASAGSTVVTDPHAGHNH
ncbi:hypothetical protein C6501_13205 [Candidatus Poribacteria bacterium]|nr:MAG: hypothetical protein C6501_13205 [Candidatus Poribacteria bacterium]